MKKIKTKGTILLDFLLVVILSITVLLSILTFLNIKSRKNNTLESVSEKSNYIVKLIMEEAKKGLNRYNYEGLSNQVKTLTDGSQNDIYKISLQSLEGEEELETVYSSDGRTGKIIKVKNINKVFGDGKVIQGDNENEDNIHVYNYIHPVFDDDELIGVLNIITSLEKLDKIFQKKMIRDMIISVIVLIIMITITTFMLLKRIYNPIQKIKEELQKIKDGDITYQVKINVNNELETIFREIGDLKNHLLENTIGDRFAHPVTGLPGLMTTIEMLDEEIEKDSYFGILSFTIRDLEPYILEYGFSNGENVLRIVSHMIQENLELDQIKEYKLTHIRENQFILLLDPKHINEFGDRLKDQFDREIVPLYNNTKESITFTNKKGEEIDYPMMSILIIGFTNKIRGEITKFKDLEDKILEIEKLNYEIKEGSQYLEYDEFKNSKGMAKEIPDEDFEEEEVKEDIELETDDDLLDGLSDVEEDKDIENKTEGE